MTGWSAQDPNTRQQIDVTEEKRQDYDGAKAEGLPKIQKEVSTGMKPIEPISFQPVKSPGIYEAEFAVKESDVIFHFWPYGYHEAESSGRRLPVFKPRFDEMLKKAMGEGFGSHRIEVIHDPDLGAYSARAFGFAQSQYNRELSIKVCQKLHELMGGEKG